jgi:hypothetical protein
MKAALRQTDFLGRYGGEEFCLVFTNTELMDAALCCERIRQRIENERFESDNAASFSLTVSFGLCQCNAQHTAVKRCLPTQTGRCMVPRIKVVIRSTCPSMDVWCLGLKPLASDLFRHKSWVLKDPTLEKREV